MIFFIFYNYTFYLTYYFYILIIFMFIFLFFNFLFDKGILKNKSNELNFGYFSYGSFPPKPPKKNWKQKVKEHIIQYKEFYIGGIIVFSVVVCYYFYGNGKTPPGTESGSVYPPMLDNNHMPLNLYSSAIENVPAESTSLSTSSILAIPISERLDFHNYIDYTFIYKYFILNFITPLALVKASLSAYIISTNSIDYSLLYMNKLHGSIGAMSFITQLNDINKSSELNSLTFNLDQTTYYLEQAEYILKLFQQNHPEFVIVDQNFTFTSYVQYIDELMDYVSTLNFNEQDDLFGLYFNFVLYPIPENLEESLAIFYQDLNRTILKTLSQGFVPNDAELLKSVNYITLKLIFNPDNYSDIPKLNLKTVDDLRLLKHHFLFQSLKLYIINLDLHDFEENELQFDLIFNFYLKLLKYYKLPPLSFVEFFCFLDSIGLEDKISNLSATIESTRSTMPQYRTFYDI